MDNQQLLIVSESFDELPQSLQDHMESISDFDLFTPLNDENSCQQNLNPQSFNGKANLPNRLKKVEQNCLDEIMEENSQMETSEMVDKSYINSKMDDFDLLKDFDSPIAEFHCKKEVELSDSVNETDQTLKLDLNLNREDSQGIKLEAEIKEFDSHRTYKNGEQDVSTKTGSQLIVESLKKSIDLDLYNNAYLMRNRQNINFKKKRENNNKNKFNIKLKPKLDLKTPKKNMAFRYKKKRKYWENPEILPIYFCN